jgi:NAD(P)H dehydrogenase (quinone)
MPRGGGRNASTSRPKRHASEQGSIPPVVAEEIERLDRAELLILQSSMWWHLPPAILKGWIDRVFIYGEVYASRRISVPGSRV